LGVTEGERPNETDETDETDETPPSRREAVDGGWAGGDADSGREPGPESGPDRGREAARARRDALSPAERERVERTVVDLLDLLGKAHTMAVLKTFAFSEGPLRFSELEARVGVAPNTLTERLKELTAAGLLHREAYDEVPPRVEYEPTEKARALFPAFGHFYRWAETHRLGDERTTTSTPPAGETADETRQ
jgi:DNA-binding HxlR family transcriptional regulator